MRLLLLFISAFILFNACGDSNYPIRYEYERVDFVESQGYNFNAVDELIEINLDQSYIDNTINLSIEIIDSLIQSEDLSFADLVFTLTSDETLELSNPLEFTPASYEIRDNLLYLDGSTETPYLITTSLSEIRIGSFFTFRGIENPTIWEVTGDRDLSLYDLESDPALSSDTLVVSFVEIIYPRQ